LLVLVGCSNSVEKAKEEQWKVSPTFSTDYGAMFGKEGKIGIIGGEVKAGKEQKWMWHFWGSEDISYKEWEAKAVHQTTNKEINPILFKDEKLTPKDKEIQGHARS
jgi:N-acetylneuraminic acid mutarotase